ncbi:hypothetical protein D3C80_1613060 [compost metagenome]
MKRRRASYNRVTDQRIELGNIIGTILYEETSPYGLATEVGLGTNQVLRVINGCNVTMDTMLTVLDGLGLEMNITP